MIVVILSVAYRILSIMIKHRHFVYKYSFNFDISTCISYRLVYIGDQHRQLSLKKSIYYFTYKVVPSLVCVFSEKYNNPSGCLVKHL